MSAPLYVDVQAALMEPVEVRTRREWRELHGGAIQYGIALGFCIGFVVGLVPFVVVAL